MQVFLETTFCDVSHFKFCKQFFPNIGVDPRRKKPFNRENGPHRKRLENIL